MSSIFSTQKRQTFLRRKYCFFCVATALSPPVGRCAALPGLPLDSAIFFKFSFVLYSFHAKTLRGEGRKGFSPCRTVSPSPLSPSRPRLPLHHLLRHRRLRRSRSRRRLAMRPLLPLLPALLRALESHVNAHCQELDYQVRNAQAPLEFLHRFRVRAELHQYIRAFPVLIHPVGELALAPLVQFVHRTAGSGDHTLHLLDELVDLLFRRVRFHDKK